MGKAHSNALRTLSYIDWPGVVRPELVAIAARTEERVAEAAVRFGYEGYYTDWRGLVADERLSVFDNAAADEAHMEPTLAAIAAGKHVACEKPLARRATDALRLWTAAQVAGVKHLCCYNYRFVPAVQLARDILPDGTLGEIYQGRFRYSQSWASLSPDGSLVTIGCRAIDQPADQRLRPGQVVVDHQAAVDVGGDVVPRRHYPALVSFGRVPRRRDAGVGAVHDSGVNARRGRDFLLATVSILDIFLGQRLT
jgi:hypothetical protein